MNWIISKFQGTLKNKIFSSAFLDSSVKSLYTVIGFLLFLLKLMIFTQRSKMLAFMRKPF